MNIECNFNFKDILKELNESMSCTLNHIQVVYLSDHFASSNGFKKSLGEAKRFRDSKLENNAGIVSRKWSSGF
jgi:hypothetical protein